MMPEIPISHLRSDMSLLLKRWTSSGDARHASPGLEAGLLGTMPGDHGWRRSGGSNAMITEWLGQMVKATTMLMSSS